MPKQTMQFFLCQQDEIQTSRNSAKNLKKKDFSLGNLIYIYNTLVFKYMDVI